MYDDVYFFIIFFCEQFSTRRLVSICTHFMVENHISLIGILEGLYFIIWLFQLRFFMRKKQLLMNDVKNGKNMIPYKSIFVISFIIPEILIFKSSNSHQICNLILYWRWTNFYICFYNLVLFIKMLSLKWGNFGP